jgi:hypothetical protein
MVERLSKEPPLEHRVRASLDLLNSAASFAVVWVVVGVPVTTLIAALAVFVWVITSLPEMAATAAVLGAVQGLWLHLAGRPSEAEASGLRWLAALSGGVLGLMGFPPVFARSSVVADRLMIAIFLVAAISGGIAAGFASASVAAMPVLGRRSNLIRTSVVSCLLLLPLAAIDYHYFWPPTVDRLPVPRVSREVLGSLAAGKARGSAWAGCYEYLGQLSRGSGVIGKEGGLLKVMQTDGALQVQDGGAPPLLGGVEADGSFRIGVERLTGRGAIRILWEGRFSGQSLDFTKRVTVIQGSRIVNTTRLTGHAQRILCNP